MMMRIQGNSFGLVLICFLLVATPLLMMVPPAERASAATDFAGGDGSAGDPWQIATPEQLNLLRHYLGSAHADKHYVLVNDINLQPYLSSGGEGYANWGDEGWLPIGDGGNYFGGHLDGDGHVIKGLSIDRPSLNCVGLFGVMAGEVRDLGIEDADITGAGEVGILVGKMGVGNISGSFSTGSVLGGYGAGGLIGKLHAGKLTTSYSTATVSGGDYIGGLIGRTSSASSSEIALVQNSYSTGAVTGSQHVSGLVGSNNGDFENNYSSGKVTGNTNVGGMVGDQGGWSNYLGFSYWNTETSGVETSLGGANVIGVDTADMKNETTFAGWDPNVWAFSEGGYPVLKGMWAEQQVDTVQPFLVEASMDRDEASRLLLDFDEAVQILDASGLTGKVNGNPVSITYESGTGSKQLAFTLGAPVVYGQTMTISYEASAGNAVDLAGNGWQDVLEAAVTIELSDNASVSAAGSAYGVDTAADMIAANETGIYAGVTLTGDLLSGLAKHAGAAWKVVGASTIIANAVDFDGATEKALDDALATGDQLAVKAEDGTVRVYAVVVVEDTTEPSVTLGTNGAEAWAKSAQTTVTVSDAESGVEPSSLQYVWSDSSITPVSGWMAFDSGDTISLSVGDGDRYLHIQAEDAAGNVVNDASHRFRLDNTAPAVSVTMEGGSGGGYANDTWTNQAVEVSVHAADVGTVTGVTYSIDSGVNWFPYVSEVELQADGVYPLSVKAVDAAGNETVEQRTVKISTSGLLLTPTLTEEGGSPYTSGEWTSEDVTVSVNASAGPSGVTSLTYKLNGGAAQPYTSGQPIVLDEAGVHALLFEAADGAGNSFSLPLAVKIDRTGPMVTFGTNGSELWDESVQTTVTVTDGESGVAASSLQYAWSSDASAPANGWTAFSSGEVLSLNAVDGDWHLHIRAQDELGNLSNVVSERFRMDTSSAELSGLSFSEGELNPAFAPGTTAYRLSVPYRADSITITPVMTDVTDTVTASVYGGASQSLTSGQRSGAIPLQVGDNEISMVNTALNGEQQTYTVTVTRVRAQVSPNLTGPRIVVEPSGEVRIIVDYASVRRDTQPDGRAAEHVSLQEWIVEQALSLVSGEQPRITIEIDDSTGVVQTELTAGALAKALSTHENLNVAVQLNGSSYQLAIAAIQWEELAERLGVQVEDLKLKIKMEEAAESLQEAAREAAVAAGHVLAGEVVDFQIIVEAGDQQLAIESFGGMYMNRSIVPDDRNGDEPLLGVLYDPETNSFYFVPSSMGERRDGLVEVMMQVPHNSMYALLEPSEASFEDMRGHWAREDVELMASKLIVQGKSASAFAPDQKITRAEFAALLVRSLGLSAGGNDDANSVGAALFADVDTDVWYAPAVYAAVDAEMVNGISEDAFAPDAPITREQMAVMMARAMAYVHQLADPEKPVQYGALDEIGAAGGDQLQQTGLAAFVDRGEIAEWAAEAVGEVVKAGIMSGLDGSRIAPAADATRAQAAVILKRLLLHLQFISD
ncbi:S-layer homology domain-containing protein [Paenibacillus sp. J5C_2022]|uniref:S-layer homology domain-containing protein n=1 Tax=Paenibacillus sp. J5C2022 TaxID=2977129 RepID=UPI0021CECB43|nr:S-layer homology domain-containing protein [Paenibacillus sp. J5C2022]MCU6712135.1 S-layer homology domain-containing protein [Paenibacillus sp. J5C2022]